MSQIDIRVGQRIRQRRIELGLSQTDLAQSLGIPGIELEEIEDGERRPAADLLIRIAHVLRVDLVELMEDD
jgi:transcriptional regulator with XRE-family HTH domain